MGSVHLCQVVAGVAGYAKLRQDQSFACWSFQTAAVAAEAYTACIHVQPNEPILQKLYVAHFVGAAVLQAATAAADSCCCCCCSSPYATGRRLQPQIKLMFEFPAVSFVVAVTERSTAPGI